MSARLRHIGRDLQSKLQGFFETPLGSDATPLELLHVTLDALEQKVQPAGRGRRIFPYDRVVVHIVQPGADRVALQAVFDALELRLRERLAELQCEAPESIETTVALAEAPSDARSPMVTVECFRDREQPARAARTTACPAVTLTILKGQCEASEYVLQEPVIAIGRTPEPTDGLGQVRYNHVAFLEARDGINETVGRAHARLQFDPSTGHFHLYNESSSNPTSIIRAGRTIRVAPRDPRGVRVRSGDQLQLGRAVVRLTIGEACAEAAG